MSFATLASNTRYAFGENRLTLIAAAMLAVMAICAVLVRFLRLTTRL
jgi:peptide/nickel transport system permease protein